MRAKSFPFFLFFCGGLIYFMIEIIARGHSHWSMFIAGGLCLVLIDEMNHRYEGVLPLWSRCVIGGFLITAVEFVAGCIVNLWAHWNVWDYSGFRFQILGQVCLPYMLLWMVFAFAAIMFSHYMRQLWRLP